MPMTTSKPNGAVFNTFGIFLLLGSLTMRYAIVGLLGTYLRLLISNCILKLLACCINFSLLSFVWLFR
jgi:hypothetical protein